MKPINENYTSVCWYCGVIFKNNRSTARYCSGKHRCLFSKYGPRINPLVKNVNGDSLTRGNYCNVDERFHQIYMHSLRTAHMYDDWSLGHREVHLNKTFSYYGPVPTDSRLLVVGSFLVKKGERREEVSWAYYSIKPFKLLTLQEKATGLLVSVNELISDTGEEGYRS